MPLRLYNTLTRKKEIFKPIKKDSVGMYVCGPTIYNYVHIGNLRAYVFADILRRYLKFRDYKVKEVMNLTDVDDKTIRESQKEKKSLREFTERYEKSFLENLKEMNIESPEVMPRATENIKEMIKIIKNLLEKGIAYKSEDGIYFSIKKFRNYGKLSRIKTKELKAGASERVSKDEYNKEDANDFALWKFYTPEDGNVFWETEIGRGRPGWHIECSAMSMKYLGERVDIHTGGVDLIFPHHENEIAQSEAFTGKKFVNYWMHNEWVLVDGKKMSKSLKNFYNLKDLEEKNYSPLVVRYFYLIKSYRQKLNFTWKNLESAKISYNRLKNIISEIKDDGKINKKYLEEFGKIMDNDLNTPKALQIIWKLIRDKKADGKIETIKKFDEVFGLKLLEKEEIRIPAELKKLIKEREKAREGKNWKKSDEIREKINKLGYAINDTKEGSVVKKR
jgi:cysteinyl-tRNA synthetase